MTPEREVWWNKLPKDQRRLRNKIKCFKKILSSYKAKGHPIGPKVMKREIIVLKRKLVVMPYVNQWGQAWCACKTKLKPEWKRCPKCGNKLRWK